MDLHQPQKCKWEGCRSYDVVFGGTYCQEHKKQYHQSRRTPSNKSQALLSSSSDLPPGLPKNPAAIQLENRVVKNNSSTNFHPAGISSATNEKRQLSDVYVARKSTKQPSNLGQTHVSPSPSIQRASVEAPSINSRPAKRQRVLGEPNLSELHPRSNSSSFSENGIPPSSNRGMCRQSEERTPKLSAVEYFALRPKHKDAPIDSARSKAYNDQQPSHQGESRPSSRQTSTSSKPPQNTSLNGVSHSAPFVIDLTGDDPEPPLPHPKPQLGPKTCIPNGTTTTVVGLQKPKRSSDGNPDDLSREQRNAVALNNKHSQEGPNQLGGISQVEHGSPLGVSTNLNTQKSPQQTLPSAPTVQATSKPTNSTPSQSLNTQQRPNAPTPNHGLGSVHINSSNSSTRPYEPPPIGARPLANGISQASLREKTSDPVRPVVTRPTLTGPAFIILEREQTVIKKPTESSVSATPTPTAPMTPPRLQASRVATPHNSHESESPVKDVQPVLLPSTEKDEPLTTSTQQGPLSALLGGREWVKMTPEERRLFWVSQHDAEAFDAQIYSENNRPFRPGDALFGLPEHMLPPRPTRPATHYGYIDPRPRYPQQGYEKWYQAKQKEISARGSRKQNFGKAVTRAAERKQAEPVPSSEQKRKCLPQRVRDNPKWLEALDVLDQLEAQARAKRMGKVSREKSSTETKDKAPATVYPASDSNFDSESDIDMELT
ncbi:hypothetical protein F4678DRAFT_55269 [Xylaria arbuscula]|nr:hypothetical protein F4678DRAFT_55269 [Xylaria arbuscula]